MKKVSFRKAFKNSVTLKKSKLILFFFEEINKYFRINFLFLLSKTYLNFSAKL